MAQLNTAPPRGEYTATAGQTVFTVPFQFYAAGDVVVTVNGAAAPSYSVGGVGDPNGGTITFAAGLALNDVVVVLRSVAAERVSDFQTTGPFDIAALNLDLDRIVQMLGEIVYAAGLQPLIDPSMPVADQVIDAHGNRLQNLADPVADNDGVTRGWVNAQLPAFEAMFNSYSATMDTKVSTAQGYADAAGTSAANAGTSESNAAGSASSAATSLANFQKAYQGGLASDPAKRPDNSALVAGDLYYNTASTTLKVYTGTAWTAAISAHTHAIAEVTGLQAALDLKGWEKVASADLSNVANVSQSLPAKYRAFRLVIRKLKVSVDTSVSMRVQVGGTLYQAASQYSWAQSYGAQSGQGYYSATGSGSTQGIMLSPGSLWASSTQFACMDIMPGSASNPPTVSWSMAYIVSAGAGITNGSGYLVPVNGQAESLLFFPGAGQFTTFSYDLYGML